MRVATIVGARPQFIKAAMVSRALSDRSGVQEILIHTGQHYDEQMSRIFFDELGIRRPDRHLEVGSASHGRQTGLMLERIETVLVDTDPDWVVVYGDTNSTLAGALASGKLNIPLAHVEAGLRSFNRKMPEEQNRIVADHLSELLLAPTETAVSNLHNEGLGSRRISRTGDVMYDAALHFAERANQESHILERVDSDEQDYVLVTVHRAENTGEGPRLEAIVSALALVARDGLKVIWPVHPRTRPLIEPLLDDISGDTGLNLIDPVGYLDMVMLERHARLIATDSGGVQKEAFFHRVPCVTLRDETEWVELVELGWNRLAPPTSRDSVLRTIREALKADLGREGNPYGDGTSAEAVAHALLDR